MSFGGAWPVAGVGSDRESSEREILWGDNRNALYWSNQIISGAARDAGNTPTTILRPGLLLGKLTTGGEFEEWDADASDGSQYVSAVLETELRMTDFDANNVDRSFRLLAARAALKARMLLIQGSALVGHADEYLARRQLAAAGFVLDDDPFGYKAGLGRRFETVTGTSDALTADQNGMTLFYNNAAAVAVTLPAIKSGLEFTIVRAADEELVVSSAAGDDIVVGNDLSADSVTVTTAGEQIGASFTFRSVYIATTLKWLLRVNVVPFSTDDYLAKTFAS